MVKKSFPKKSLVLFIFCVSFVLISLFFSFSFVLAQRELEVNYPTIGGFKPQYVNTSLPEYARYIFNFAIIGVSILFLGVLIKSGVIYLTSAGNVAKLKDAKDQVFSAILGMVILLSSYLILTTINPQLVMFEIPTLQSIISPRPASCTTDADCRPGTLCKNNLCVSKGPAKISSILSELPLGQALEKGLWEIGMWDKEREEERRIHLTQLIERIEDFFKAEIKVNPTFNSIADLNKYLVDDLTQKCTCDKLTTICTKPENSATEVGLSGDPCKKVRGDINKVLERNAYLMGRLFIFKMEVQKQKNIFEENLLKYQEIENEIANCQEETKEIFSLSEYLELYDFYREQGWNLEIMKNYIDGGDDPLTFFCSAGGTVQDYYTSEETLFEESFSKEILEEEVETEETSLEEGMSCPVEYQVGEIFDNARTISISIFLLLDNLESLLEAMADKIQVMAELTFQCNQGGCEAKCNCIRNPCYIQYEAPFCYGKTESPCIQALGGAFSKFDTHEGACPRQDLKQTLEEIEQIEKEIFSGKDSTIKKLKENFTAIEDIKNNDLNPLRNSIRSCYSDDPEDPTWMLLSCDSAKDSVGPDGQIIQNCNPRSYFCCTSSKDTLPPSVSPPRKAHIYTPPLTTYIPLGTINGCPEGWLCNDDVRFYNQYNDASEPLKQLIACMREKLDIFQNDEKIKEEYPGTPGILGRITSISDTYLYTTPQKCDWTQGPLMPGGCQHGYTRSEKVKPQISAHYGGKKCNMQEKSYAVDIGVMNYSYEKIYALDIQEIAQQCDAFVWYGKDENHKDHLHISPNQTYALCGSR